MSSRFVSAGSKEKPGPQTDEWLKAQEAIETGRRQRQEEGKQEGGKSLYEALQQNKTAKQEAFEESIRLKNQFRTLDDDEVDFLDSVLESTRAKEKQVKKETAEQLEVFQKQREAAEKALVEGDALGENTIPDARVPPEDESWVTRSRKRRRVPEKEDGILKLRKKSSTVPNALQVKPPADSVLPDPSTTQGDAQNDLGIQKNVPTVTAMPKPEDVNVTSTPRAPVQNSPPTLGLGAYSSDED